MVRALPFLGSVAALASSASAKEIEMDKVMAAELYDSGVIHRQLLDAKHVCTLDSDI